MAENSKPTQCDRLLEYMKKRSITQIEALQELGIMRLASRISDLRKLGYLISRKMIVVKNRFGEKCEVAEYSLEGELT